MNSEVFNPSDAEWALLMDEDVLTEKRGAAEHKYRDLSGTQIKGLRKLAKSDAFFLASGCLEYTLLSEGLHGHYYAWLSRMRGERYRMTLLPRDHYKSTCNTITDSVQMALPGGEDMAHPYNQGPNIKLLLSHERRETASRFLFEIMKAFRDKPLMLALFPELIPSPRVQRMNKFELELPRDIHHKEPTFDTIGVGGASQGGHYHWLKLDDLVGKEAMESLTVMESVLNWFDNINSLLTRLRYDGWDLIGTRWAPTDVYSHAVKMYGVKKELSILNAYEERDIESMEDGPLVTYARGAIEKGEPIFPEEFTLEDLSILRRNKKVWASQYANNPRDGSLTKFQPDWLKFYNVGRGDRLVIFDGTSSYSVYVRELDRCIFIDPSVGETKHSDESGIVVTGTDSRLNIYVLEAYKKHLKPPELIDEMIRLYMKWTPRLVSIEDVAFQAALKYWFEEKCRQLHVYPSIFPYKPGSKRSKEARIEGLATYAAAGQIFVLEGMHQLRDEWEWFPIGDSKHILDALAQGPESWVPARKVQEVKEVEQARESLMAHRDALTGYSAM